MTDNTQMAQAVDIALKERYGSLVYETTISKRTLNMSDFLGDEATVQNDEKEIPINLLVPWENQPFKMYSDFKMNELEESIKEN